jgi:hypothetical protein
LSDGEIDLDRIFFQVLVRPAGVGFFRLAADSGRIVAKQATVSCSINSNLRSSVQS